MTYFISDIHGEYELFLRLLDKIVFSDSDTLIILGDMIDKGRDSIKLVDFIRRQSNVKAIIGNHEYDFLKYYDYLMRSCDGGDFDFVLEKLQAYFSQDRMCISFEITDFLESLPPFIEEADYVCVHSGVETDRDGMILPMNRQRMGQLVYNRYFKEDDFCLASGQKTVLFGHTPCSYKNGSGAFIKTPKKGISFPRRLSDYAKIQLDCGVSLTGVIGVLCYETMEKIYVKRR